ncbi:uncharacterized protein LOC131889842 [Tigriopus californicus]|uniref:uncharacterized protein LOC131889842 n=1 Tax=Tigriopus californicus TaxID=6832 RepID=UPI0027D9D439|nr:uncharacterized protein LOC131889842 [Tigriopus californicus]
MSLHYVTRKLKTQSLSEGSNDNGHNDHDEKSSTNDADDSGTESDEDMDKGTPRSRPDNTEATQNAEGNKDCGATTGTHLRDSGALCEDNYSSEEELKEINGAEKKKTYVDPVVPVITQCVSAQSVTIPTAEKRKWSAVSGEEHGLVVGHRASSNGSSGDEEVFAYLAPSPSSSSLSSDRGPSLTGDTPTPVQFCASPPIGVYRPNWHHDSGGGGGGLVGGTKGSSTTRSPPPKLFHMSSQDHTHGPGVELRDSGQALKPREVTHKGNHPRPSSASELLSSLSFSSQRLHGSNCHPVDLDRSLLSATGQCSSTQDEEIRLRFSGNGNETFNGRYQPPSPNKRHRSRTPRPQHMQRPCLDFEKMQQIKTRVVTSWRPQGTELSLFCW